MIEIRYGIKYFFLNNIVRHIPIWVIRKKCYQICGMKIGKSRILMNVIIDGCKNIEIGDGCCINQFCELDGRGGLKIGNNVSLSAHTIVVSATHDKDSIDFKYVKDKVIIEDRVWTGVRSIILPGTYLQEGSILAAGSVAIKKGKYEKFSVYSGVPAIKITSRNNKINYDLTDWKPFLR